METKIMAESAKYAPLILTILAFGTFAGVGIFLTDYYSEILNPRFGKSAFYLAVFLALIHEATRFALLISSMRDFSDNRSLNGWLGIVGSVGLVAHDLKTAAKIGSLYGSDTFAGLITFLVLIGLLLEFRLILTIERRNKAIRNVVREPEIQFPDYKPAKNGKTVFHN